ncbi:twin-arginine translocation signal domain-containing protein (plasmid) [Haloferax sp. S1W]|uniref:twin-arginine translocation signal domain-containing protein n=1 Tax=Haloferax sp. S1W TaxID=3377110 RepID=UPI0037C5B7BD
MKRRDVLRTSGAAVAAGFLAGCVTFFDGGRTKGETKPDSTVTMSPSEPNDGFIPSKEDILDAPTTLHGITFDTVLHAVDDLGMDPTGTVPIDDAFDEGYGDGTLIAFPPGDYLATDEHRYRTPTHRFGLIGLGESRRDVQFVFPPGNEGAPDPTNFRFLMFTAGRDVVIENLTFQMTDDDVTGVETIFILDDGFWMVDVEFAGFMPRERYAPSNNVIAHITDPDGVGVIRRFVSLGGGVVGTYPSRGTPIGVFWSHRGELRLEDAHIEESGSHSIYASRAQGCIRVEGGLFRNNDNTNLRISGGGHPTKRSWIRGARVEIDVDRATKLPPGEHYESTRGIWVEAGGSHNPGYGNLLIEDVDAVIYSNGSASNLPLLLIDSSHGSVTVRNSRFRSFVEHVEPIDVREPSAQAVNGPTEVHIENTVVETTAKRVIDEGAALSISGRPNSTVTGSTIKLVDGWVDGIRVERSDGFTATDLEIISLARTDPPTAENLADEAFGWNRGIIIRGSVECNLRRLVIAVPGVPTYFEDSQVEVELISLSRSVRP